ncbi:hypothetical protein SAMN05216516_11023 [Izhakiella capsodis]|uniref:Uncharacterized protein n=1 Tax=Izhakiella capsodis TaxID=1367852 RepID=A0A1I4ZWF1_9GAMM|nr:hypothetical protein SAMN05216516_11023 [Izhakiella capsodis]
MAKKKRKRVKKIFTQMSITWIHRRGKVIDMILIWIIEVGCCHAYQIISVVGFNFNSINRDHKFIIVVIKFDMLRGEIAVYLTFNYALQITIR